jgi:ubiquitin-like domain-containing CTD phosphatase 1
LAASYAMYDIIIWSATDMKWVEVKMGELGCLSNPNYKITCMLDHGSMITVNTDKYGCVPRIHTTHVTQTSL